MSRYAELKCYSHYSFLRGASSPAELIAEADRLKLRALAITDKDGVYGIPKAYLAAREHPELKLIVGSEITLAGRAPITLLARDRAAYGLLCRIITEAHADKPKGQASLAFERLLEFLGRPGAKGLFAFASPTDFDPVLKDLLGERLSIPLSRHLLPDDRRRALRAIELSGKYGIPIIATNDVHFHQASRRKLQDVVTSIRECTPLDEAGFRLFSNGERYLKSARQMEKLFQDMPAAITRTLEIAEQCTFCPSELRYHYPSEWIPAGETAQSWLEKLVWKGAAWRYGSRTPEDVIRQLKHELRLIEELQFADYFLTIWEIVDFARSRDILCQGRGSAANSAVCYCLGITAIDPVRMNLLFERFISIERGEPPDIDVDFEHERREEVIQHIYEKYGRDRAAMVSAVVTYRSRSCIREVTKAFGDETDKRTFLKKLESPEVTPELKLQHSLMQELSGFPRHLSIHSGGFTLSADPIIETVPVEPARMEGRTIVQWDKYDLEALGLLKVDILSLGMLTALKKTLKLVNDPGLTLATIPPEDPATYRMIQRADTIGTFQIESRAQMSMLPRLLPKTFYDLVVEVAIVRPGPIVGRMVHPYLKRRRGQEPVTWPDERLRPILERTLGVPLFQEQVMKIAIILAGFSPGEADELRRAIGSWKAASEMEESGDRPIDHLSRKLMQGLLANGLPQDYADLIFQQLQGFAEYGFPESHAASFALIAYASAWLKCHYPAEFTCALLNSQPMGFYRPHTLVDDVKRHGVTVLPLHPNISQWDCTIENRAIRIGWRYLSGISRSEVGSLLTEREKRPFSSLEDFLSRAPLRRNMLYRLATGDAFSCFGLDQRQALWRILGQDLLIRTDVGREPGTQLSLFSAAEPGFQVVPAFQALDPHQAIQADYASYHLSTRGHPMAALRARFPRLAALTTAQARRLPGGRVIHIAGLLIVMQRPPTAKGTAFATLEDEFGFLDLIFHRQVFEKYRDLLLEHPLFSVKGVLQKDGQSISLLVREMTAKTLAE